MQASSTTGTEQRGAAPAAAASAASSSRASSSSRTRVPSSSARAAAPSSMHDMNFFGDSKSTPLALAEMAAPFSQAAAAILKAATADPSRSVSTPQLRAEMEAELDRVLAAIDKEEKLEQQRVKQLERLQRDLPMLQAKLARADLCKIERKAAVAARAVRQKKLAPKNETDATQRRMERTEQGARIKVEMAESVLLDELATSRFQAARDFESAQLLTSDPSHPDHARIREEILAESAKLKVANAKKKEEHERYFERKRAEETAEIAEIARVKALEEEMEKEKKLMDEMVRRIQESDALMAVENDLAAEWNRLLEAAHAGVSPPPPSAHMANSPGWMQWMQIMDQSRQHRVSLSADHKELEDRLAVVVSELAELRVDRTRIDEQYAQEQAQLQQLMEQQQQRRAAVEATRAGASTATARTAPQSLQQDGRASEDEKMSDDAGATRSMQPQRTQQQQQQRLMQQRPMQPAMQRNLPSGFIPAAPQPGLSGFNARAQQFSTQRQPFNAVGQPQFRAGQGQPMMQPQRQQTQAQPQQPPYQARQQTQHQQQQQPQQPFGGGRSTPLPPYPSHTAYRSFGPNQAIHTQMQPQMQPMRPHTPIAPTGQQQSRPSSQAPPLAEREYFPYSAEEVARRHAQERSIIAQQEAAEAAYRQQQTSSFLPSAQRQSVPQMQQQQFAQYQTR